MRAIRYTARVMNREEKQLFRRDRIDIDSSPTAIKPDAAVNQRENCVIATESDVFSGQKFRAALAHNDVPGQDRFAAESFYTKPFANAVAAILNAALSFFVSHRKKSLVES